MTENQKLSIRRLLVDLRPGVVALLNLSADTPELREEAMAAYTALARFHLAAEDVLKMPVSSPGSVEQ